MIYLLTLVWCGLGTTIPVFNAEAWVVVNALFSEAHPLGLALGAAIGQCIFYTIYFVGAGEIVLRIPWIRRKLERFDISRYQGAGYTVLLLASTVGLPPLVMLSIVARSLQYRYLPFVGICLGGRILRFAVLAYAPETFQEFFGAQDLTLEDLLGKISCNN